MQTKSISKRLYTSKLVGPIVSYKGFYGIFSIRAIGLPQRDLSVIINNYLHNRVLGFIFLNF